jgi:hypothetical protein
MKIYLAILCAFILTFNSNLVLAAEKIVFPLAQYAPGVYEFSSQDVTTDAKTVTISALRNHWADTGREVVSIEIEYSKDGGQTWQNLFGFKTMGGDAVDRKTGILQNQSWVEFAIPDIGNPDRKIKGRLETYTALSTQLTLGIK